MSDTFGIDPDKRSDVPTGDRRSGVTGGQGLFDKYMNQLIYELRQNHIWGTQAQVALGDATIYSDSAGAIFDKNAVDVTANLQDDDKILMVHDATLAANLKLQPTTAKRLNIGMAKGAVIDFGDAGSGVPFKLILGGNIAKGSEAIFRGNFDFRENTLSNADKRLIANQARGVKIKYNQDVIYDPNHTGDIVYRDTKASNPYLLEYDGVAYDWLADASNVSKAWFRDLNVYLDGLVFNGATYDETRGRFTLPAGVAYKFQVNKGFGFLRQLASDDPDIHSRTDINGVSVADTASFVDTTNIVTFVDITDIKNGMRLSGADAQGIPEASSGTPGTTILKNVDTAAKTAEMVDALTGADVDATATVGSIAVTMDNSGAAGGSKQIDAMQKITGDAGIQSNMGFFNSTSTDTPAGVFTKGATLGNEVSAVANNADRLAFDSSLSVSPNTAKTSDDDTYPKSIGTLFYQRP